MKARHFVIAILLLLCVACHTPTREARRMVKRAEQLADTLPDSTVRLIDSVLHMPVYFSERERMDMALLQAEALFGDRGTDLSPIMDDDFFDDHADLSTSPELERAATYFAQKKQYAKAAHAALYSGFVQQHYDEKENAMRSFKEAEQFGGLAVDSLTVARAQYRMGKMLLDDGLKEESLAMLQTASLRFGDCIVDKALALNMMGVCFMLQNDLDNAETCLQQGLLEVGKKPSNSSKVNLKLLNNYAVLYRIQGNYIQAIDTLHRMLEYSNLNENEFFMLNLNLGNVYFDRKNLDSAAMYYDCVAKLMLMSKISPKTQLAAYESLSKFANNKGIDSLALQYREDHEDMLYAVMQRRQKQNTYRIQQQYDYESLQNEMNRKLIRKQRLITFIGLLAIIGLAALAISQIRLAKIRKQEAEAKASLFHFMQQNKELVESNKAHEKKALDTTQQLSDLLYARLKAMQKLDYCLKAPKDKIALKDLEKEVFGEGDHWEAIKEVLVALYPGLWEALKLKYPDMDEMERRVFMLSYLKLSRLGEATLLGISTSVLDKLRTKVRKTMEQSQMP